MTKVLKSAICPNGRFGKHHVSVEERATESGCEYVWRNGYSDPLMCSYEQAVAFFNDRIEESTLELMEAFIEARDDLSRSFRKEAIDSFFASIKE